MQKQEKNEEFDFLKLSPEAQQNMIGFCNTLKNIHIRLINEGYVIKDNKIISPKMFRNNK